MRKGTPSEHRMTVLRTDEGSSGVVDGIVRLFTDGVGVPMSDGAEHMRAVLARLESGNAPTPSDAPFKDFSEDDYRRAVLYGYLRLLRRGYSDERTVLTRLVSVAEVLFAPEGASVRTQSIEVNGVLALAVSVSVRGSE